MLYKFMNLGQSEFLHAAWDAFATVGLDPGKSVGCGRCDLWTALVLRDVIRRGIAAPLYINNLNIKAFCEYYSKHLDAAEDLWLAGLVDGWGNVPARPGYSYPLYLDGYNKGFLAQSDLCSKADV